MFKKKKNYEKRRQWSEPFAVQCLPAEGADGSDWEEQIEIKLAFL